MGKIARAVSAAVVAVVGVVGSGGVAFAQEDGEGGGQPQPDWPDFTPKKPDAAGALGRLTGKLGDFGGELGWFVIAAAVVIGIVGVLLFMGGRGSGSANMRGRGTEILGGVLMGAAAVVMLPSVIFGIVSFLQAG